VNYFVIVQQADLRRLRRALRRERMQADPAMDPAHGRPLHDGRAAGDLRQRLERPHGQSSLAHVWHRRSRVRRSIFTGRVRVQSPRGHRLSRRVAIGGVAFPYCRASTACDTPLRLKLHSHATIAIAFHHHNSSVRAWFKAQPINSYLYNVRLLVRLLLSLRSVGTTLPVSVLLSGERHAPFEALLASLGALLVDADAFATRKPPWASEYHVNSFTKLRALSLTEYRRVVVLDTDMVVLQNIDALASSPAPAFVFRPTPCIDRATIVWRPWEMNSGVMVLQPTRAELGRLHRLLNSTWYAGIGHRTDSSDQSFWRHFFDEVYELPIRYNAMGVSNLTNWEDVHVFHDVESYRKGHPPPSDSPAAIALANLTSTAKRMLRSVCDGVGLAC